MTRRVRGAALSALALGAACASADHYVDRTAPDAGPWGYEDRQLPDGRYEVVVILPGYVTDEAAMAMWDRRAEEICGGPYEKNIFEAQRPTVLYSSYGGAPGGPQLRGLLACRPGEAGAD